MYYKTIYKRFFYLITFLFLAITQVKAQDTTINLEQFEIVNYKLFAPDKILSSSDSSLKQINIDSVYFYHDTLKIKAYTFANYYLMHNEEIIIFLQDNRLLAILRSDMDIHKELKEAIINSGRKEFYNLLEDSIMIRYNTIVNLNSEEEILVNEFLKGFSSLEIRDRKKCSMPIYSINWKSKKATIKDYSERWEGFDRLRDSLFLKEDYR